MPGTGKMKHVSLTLQVENDLKHQLSIGALKPGARLITKNLAEQLGMSITPVREALLRLVSVNALSVTPAQAFTVPEVGKRQLDEINRIRYELELMAVTLAVENLTPPDLAELQELLEKLLQAQEKGDMEQIINANRLFRLAIYHRSNMPILCEMIEQLWVRMGPGLHYLYEVINPAELRERIENYRLLLAALKAKTKRDADIVLLKLCNKILLFYTSNTIVKVNARQIPGIKVITQISTQYSCRHHNFVRAQVRNIARLTH